MVLSAQPTAGRLLLCLGLEAGRSVLLPPRVSIPVKCPHCLHDAQRRGPGYRTIKKTGSAVNKTIRQTKAAMSILLPQCLATDEAFEDGV